MPDECLFFGQGKFVKEVIGILDGHSDDLGDIFPSDSDGQWLGLESGAFTGWAGQVAPIRMYPVFNRIALSLIEPVFQIWYRSGKAFPSFGFVRWVGPVHQDSFLILGQIIKRRIHIYAEITGEFLDDIRIINSHPVSGLAPGFNGSVSQR